MSNRGRIKRLNKEYRISNVIPEEFFYYEDLPKKKFKPHRWPD